MIPQANHDVLDCLLLKGQGLLNRTLGGLAGNRVVQMAPKVDLADSRLKACDLLLSGSGPAAGGGDPTMAEHLALREGEKGVDIPFTHRVALLIALALNRGPTLVVMLRHEVDAEVATVEAGQGLALGPVAPAVDSGHLVLWVLGQDAGEEFLEPTSFLVLVARLAADAVEHLADSCFSGLQVKTDLLLDHA